MVFKRSCYQITEEESWISAFFYFIDFTKLTQDQFFGSSPAPLTVLHELHVRRPDILYRNEVYIDGGIERGTDVLKALCLGARAVGLGRAFLYGNSLWGEAGVRKVIQSRLFSPLIYVLPLRRA